MADGRKIPYLIELIADDKKIRQQMAKINWEELLGSKGKGFGDVLVSDAKEAKDQIKRTLGGLDIDWSKILGAKEIGQLEQAVTKALSKSRKEIELFAASGDTTGLEKTIKYVSALGDELKVLGSSFDAAGLARGMGAFMKVLIPLTAKFEALADEPKKVEAAFDKLFSSIATSAKSVDLGKTFDVSGKIKIAMQGLKATNDEILEATESLEKYRNVVAKLSGDNPATIKLAQDVAGLNQQLDEQMRKEEQLAAQNKTNSAQYAATLKNIMAIENARLKLKEKPTKDYTGMEIREDFGYYEEQINKVVERISKKMEEVEGKLANTVDKSFAEIISKQISDIKLSVSLSEQAEKQFINEINAFVKKVNQSPIEKVQIQIDDAANVIENKQVRPYGKNEGDDDANTTKIVEQTEKRLDRIATSIKGKQDQIVGQTKNWRQQMLEQFKFKSGDFEFKFNDNLVEELQTLFDEYGLKINIDPTYLADQIKTVLEGSSVSLGGGTASIDPSAMASAVMTGVRAALVGEPLTVHTPVNAAQERIPDATEQVATEIEQTAKHLDIAEEYVQDVVKKIQDVARYATKHIGTDKDSNGAISTREKFKLLGIDLEKVNSEKDGTVIAKMLEDALLPVDEFGDIKGVAVVDELSKFKDSSSKTISAFLESIDEVFYNLQINTSTVEQWVKKRQSKKVFDSANEKAKAARSLQTVRSAIKQGDAPSLEEIDKITADMSAYWAQLAKRQLTYKEKDIEALALDKRTSDPSLDFNKSLEMARQEIYEKLLTDIKAPFTQLREARVAMGDATEGESVEAFRATAQNFFSSTKQLFVNLKKQAEDTFKGTVFVRGKNGLVPKQIEKYKDFARIKDDAVIVDVEVNSSLNDVALGVVNGKYSGRPSAGAEKQMMRGQHTDFTVPKRYERAILERPVEYAGFKQQGIESTQINIEASIENLKKRISETTDIIPKLQKQIDDLDSEVEIKRQEAKKAHEFSESVRKNPDATKSEKTDAVHIELKTYDAFFNALNKQKSLTKQIDDARTSQDRARNLIKQLELTEQHNVLLAKSLELKGSIVKMEKDGAPQKELQSSKQELDGIHARLTEIVSEAAEFGGLYQQSVGRDYSEEERKIYALQEIEKIDKDLITAKAQVRVAENRLAQVDKKLKELETWKLGAGYGATELAKIKDAKEQEFKSSAEYKSFDEALVEKIRNAKQQAEALINQATNTHRDTFNEKVTEAMIRDGLNPYDKKATEDFLKTQRGQQLATQYEQWVEEDTKRILNQYNVDVEEFRRETKELQKQALESYKKRLVDGDLLDYGEIRENLKRKLEEEREHRKQEYDPDKYRAKVAQLETDRETAIAYGGVGDKEILSPDIIEDLIRKTIKQKELEAEREKILKDIEKLEKAGVQDSDDSVKQANKEKERLDKEIARYEMLIRNRKKLVEMRYDESKEPAYTDEEKELHFTNQIVGYNQKIEDSLAKQEELKQKIAIASDEEKEKLQYTLKQEEDKVAGWRGQVSKFEGKLQNVGTAKSEVAATKGEVSGGLLGVIKEAVGEVGSGNVDLTQITDILQKILDVLNGGQITTVTEAPPYKEIAKEKTKSVAKGTNATDSAWKELKALAKKAYDEEKSGDKQLSDVIKGLVDKIKDPNVDDKTKMSLQRALQLAVEDFGKQNKDTAGLEYKTNKQGHQYLPTEEIDKYLKLEEGTIKTLKLTKAQAVKQLAESDKQVKNEKAKTAETKKQAENTSKDVQKQSSDTGLNSLAKNETLLKILDVLNKIKTEGVKKAGTKTPEKKEERPKKTEADLIRDGALKQQDVVKGLAAGRGSLYDQYMKDVDDLNKAVEEANAADEKHKKKAIAKVKTQAQKVSALSYNILKNTSEWDYLVAQSDTGARNLNVKKGESLRDKMEKMALREHGIVGKNGRKLKNPQNQYEFLGFDGETLSYQLTDIEGKTRKVTMVWNEFNKQVVIASDKSVSKLDELAGKIETFDSKFKNAVDAGYLGETDEDLKEFYNAIVKINDAIADGKSFDDVKHLRNEALRVADQVDKKVAKNKRSYSGTTEITAATRQRTNMEARGVLDHVDLEMVQEYNKVYDDLIKKHNEFKVAGTLYDPKNQKTLQELAITAKDLGKRLEKSFAESEQLKELVNNSGFYKGKQMSGQHMLSAEETQHLEMSMKSYLQSLNLGNLEHVKFDHTNQKLSATLRTSNKTVADLEVKYNEATGALYAYQKAERESLTGIPAFINGFKKKFNSIMQYLSMTMSIHQVLAELRKGVQYVREIDLALTELKKVTDETEETYDKFLDTAAKTGARLGTTISAVTEATATFAKLGYSMEQATEMAESAIVYKNVGDNIASTEDAADSIISTMKGFRLEASESMAIVDRFNEVGNRFAITSQGIGEALRLSASALSEGGNSLDESIGLITAANEVVNDPSSVGTALKTLTLRLRGSKTELEEMGEDVSDMATTTSQLQAKLLALTGGQVDIMVNPTTFKNSTQILREMADAWEDMNDIQRASALELMGGKRQANTLSALIQNFDTVEKVIETSANSAGSALKENERYLDSIQGKIDQFNNATQAMWSGVLDSDTVKGFVAFGTEIIKIIDKIGLLNTTLLAFGAFKGLGAIFGIFKDAGVSIEFFAKKLGAYLLGINAVTDAETTLTQAQVAQKLTQQGLTAEQAQAIAAQTGLATSTANLSRETLMASLQAQGYSAAEAEAIATKIFGTTVTNASTGALLQETIQRKLQNSALVQYAISMKLATAADVAKMTTTQLLGLSFKALGVAVWGATKAIIAFLFTNPVGWIILAIGAIAGGIAIFNHFHKTTEELTEELGELKNELQDVKTEIETVNSELETMEDRMAELLAKDSLSFVEQEELNRLQKENNELQRRLDLLEAEEKIKQDKAAETFVQTMESYGDKFYGRGGEMNWWQRLWNGDSAYAESQDEYIDRLMGEYDRVLKVDSGELDRSVLIDELDADWYSEKIGAEVQALVDAANGLDYYVGDNLTDQQKEVNEWLDYVYNTQDKLAIMRGGENAKTNAINRIFDKDENNAISDSIDDYVEALRNGDTNAKIYIDMIIKHNHALVKDLKASGLSINETVDYFTSFASELEFATLEGKIAEMQNATSKMRKLFSDPTFSDFNSLFNVETGEISETAIAEYFQGTSEATRAEIARLIKDIKDGEIGVENALKQFEIFSIQSSLDIYITEVQTNFKDVFVDLEDADGLISTFEELGEAIGSAASALDTLNQAQAEMAYSGHVSIETALQLMEYTDDYGSVLEVVDGKLQLVEGAENNLIQARINAIKTSAEASLSDATNAYNKAVLATQEYKSALTTDMSAEVVAKSWEKVLAAGAGLWEGIKSLITDESWSDAYNRGYNETLSKITGYETEYNDSGLQALAEAEAEAKALMEQAQDRVELANQLTPETLESIHSSEEASGGNGTEEEVEDDRFQREMDYWENRIGANQARYEQLQNEIDLLEAKGQKADTSFYEEQIKLENQRLFLLGEQKKAALAHLDTLEEGSEEWWEVANTLNDIESELDDVTASIVDLQDAIGEIDTYKFEEFNTRLDDITSKLGTIRDLIAPDGEEDWFNDQGEWTEEGVAVLGTYIQELETYKQGLAEAEDAYANYVKEYAGNEAYYAELGIHSEQELYDKRQELIEQQYDYAQSISDTEQSVVDMYESNIDAVEEYTESLIDSYNDYIDSVKEALDAERDLYDFKKKIKNQTKEIAAIERRIASLSGSTNASDIAERRRLEADLYGAREELDDTYYDHVKTTQQEALDNEAAAYKETMTRFIDGLRVSLDQATTNMDEFLMSVTSMVTLNADTVLTKYQETELPLSDAITNPWEAAKTAVGNYSGDALDLMNKWTQGGFFTTFPETVKGSLTSPWSAGSTAAGAFKTSVSTVMSNVVSNISTNVKTASGELAKLYQQIKDTEKRAAEAKVVVNPNPTPPQYPSSPLSPTQTPTPEPTVKLRGLMKTSREMILGPKSFVDANTETINGTKYYRDSKTGYYYKISDLNSKRRYDGGRTVGWAIPKGTWFYTKHAKGTTGTTRDEWAITDEPQFGDELTMYATPEGTLSFMRAGSTVIPADLTRELIDLPKVVDGLINRPKFDSGINMIANAINKPEIVIDMENFLKVDRVDKDTLPQLEAMMDKKIDTFAKQLNYSIKKFAR